MIYKYFLITYLLSKLVRVIWLSLEEFEASDDEQNPPDAYYKFVQTGKGLGNDVKSERKIDEIKPNDNVYYGN